MAEKTCHMEGCNRLAVEVGCCQLHRGTRVVFHGTYVEGPLARVTKAVQQSGISAEEATRALRRLNTAINEAESAVSVQRGRRKDVADWKAKYKMGTPTERPSFFKRLFGRR